MIDAAKAVIQFNHSRLGIEPRPICPMPSDEYEHLRKAISEEIFKELAEAWAEEDVVAMVDAKIDAIYFLIGGLYKCGLTAQQIHDCFMHVHEKNMTKVKGVVASRAVGSAPDAIKPDDFIAPEIGIAAILGFCPTDY